MAGTRPPQTRPSLHFKTSQPATKIRFDVQVVAVNPCITALPAFYAKHLGPGVGVVTDGH